MSLREKINSTPLIGAILAAGLVTLAVWLGYSLYQPGISVPPIPTSDFYTDDDGKTYFIDSVYHFPPFQHDGKVAVGAVVYSYSGGKFVGVLRRYTPETRRLLQSAYDKYQAGTLTLASLRRLMVSEATLFHGTEVKLPGPGHTWVERAGATNLQITAPGGGDVTQIHP